MLLIFGFVLWVLLSAVTIATYRELYYGTTYTDVDEYSREYVFDTCLERFCDWYGVDKETALKHPDFPC